VHGSKESSTWEQVDFGSLELAGTRPAQNKTQPFFLDETMHFVEQARQPLHLVNFHRKLTT
jgi:hypothetical protein